MSDALHQPPVKKHDMLGIGISPKPSLLLPFLYKYNYFNKSDT